MERCRCGQQISSDDRYCRHCGAALKAGLPGFDGPLYKDPVGDQLVSGSVAEATLSTQLAGDQSTQSGLKASLNGNYEDDKIEMLVPVSGPATTASNQTKTQTQSVGKRSSAGLWVLGAAVVGLVGLFALTTDRSEEQADAPQPAEAQVNEDENDPADSEDTDDRSDSETNNTDEAGDGSDIAPNENNAEPESPSRQSAEFDDLALLVGNQSSNDPPMLVDIATGELAEVGQPGWTPVAATGAKTVFVDDQAGFGPNFFLLDLRQPNEEAITFGGDSFLEFVSLDDTIWFIEGSFGPTDGSALVQYALNGTKLTELPLPGIGGNFSTAQVGRVISKDIVSTDDGGIYARDDNTLTRVSEGRVLAANTESALVRRCDEQLNCTTNWYDTETWGQLVYAEPNLGQDFWLTGIDKSGRRLLTVSFSTGFDIQIIDVASGQWLVTVQIPEDGAAIFAPALAFPAISPNGRWVFNPASRLDDQQFIIDLDSDGLNRFEVSIPNVGSSAVFIDFSG